VHYHWSADRQSDRSSGKGQLFRATLVQLSKIGLARHASEYRSLYLPGAVTTYRFRGRPLEHRITARSSK
jgi:hypothetical protein